MKHYNFEPINLKEFVKTKYYEILDDDYRQDLKILSVIFPFKVNKYILEELIDWDNWENDPIFRMIFPNRKMLNEHQFQQLSEAYKSDNQDLIKKTAIKIWKQLNPHTEGQLDLNVPILNGQKLFGLQHQYQETVLAFPSRGQTCHAY